jgi:hypothetical protein
MRTVYALKVRAETGKVQCLATRGRWPGIVLSGGAFYNLDYVKGIKIVDNQTVHSSQ